MTFNWYKLKEECVSEVARELARLELLGENYAESTAARLARWIALAEAARPEAEAKIKGMNGLELLDLISQVAGYD